jgi:hypothetical protein
LSTTSFTTSHPKNDDWTLSENFHQIIIQKPHHTSAQPHDATTDPVNSIPEEPPVTWYLKTSRAAAGAGKLKKKKYPTRTLLYDRNQDIVASQIPGEAQEEIHHAMQTQGSWRRTCPVLDKAKLALMYGR